MRAFDKKKGENKSSNTFFSPKIQTKLQIGTSGDRYEVEADKVADKVVNKPKGGLLQSKSEEIKQKPLAENISMVQKQDMKEEETVQKKTEEKEETVQKKEEEKETVQAKCKDCDEDGKVQKKSKEEEKPVQTKSDALQPKTSSSSLETNLNRSKGSGQKMEKSTQQEMEAGFGSDFSNVSIHTDSNAVQMSEEMGALAFTHGNDVYFNNGKYDPSTKKGKHLLAHELTHTVQQNGTKQKAPTIQKSAIYNNGSENLEAEKFKNEYRLEQAHDDLDYLATGSKGEPVEKLQSGLMDLGYELPKFGADGDFGSETRAAVFEFQSDNDLIYDGIVGEQTIGHLDDIHAVKQGKKKKKVIKPCVKKKNNKFDYSETFRGTTRVPFITSESCFRLTFSVKAECLTKNCTGFDLNIDDDPLTKKTLTMNANHKKEKSFTFDLEKPGSHNIVFIMPKECRGAFTIDSSVFIVSGKIEVKGGKI